MTLPFSTEQFFQLFARYNAAIWPAQVVAYALGLLALASLSLKPPLPERLLLGILAVLWAWNGIAYHALFFATINPAAKLFAVFFVLQAVLFAAAAVANAKLRVGASLNARTLLAASLIAYALLVYEVLGYMAGHGFLQGPVFGVAPCPTTIFTIGLLLLVRGPALIWLSIIPLAWAFIGASAAVLLGVPQDLALVVAAAILLGALGIDYWRKISTS